MHRLVNPAPVSMWPHRLILCPAANKAKHHVLFFRESMIVCVISMTHRVGGHPVALLYAAGMPGVCVFVPGSNGDICCWTQTLRYFARLENLYAEMPLVPLEQMIRINQTWCLHAILNWNLRTWIDAILWSQSRKAREHMSIGTKFDEKRRREVWGYRSLCLIKA